MATESRAPRMASIGALLLLAFACLLYLALIRDIVPSPAREFIQRGEPASNAIQEAFTELVAFVLILLLWIVLAILLFRRGKGQKMPPRALVAAAILLPLSGVAAIYATDLYASYAGWAIVVPALLPPLIALYAMWMRLPALRAALLAKIINAAAWGAMLVLTFAPVPLSVIDARIYAAGEPERQRQREAYLATQNQIQAQFTEQTREQDNARFEALNVDSPLRDYLLDLSNPSRHEEALAKARQVKSRQSDAVALLEEPTPADTRARSRGNIEWLEDLWKLDIEATPAVCKAYGDALRQEAEKVPKYLHDQTNGYAWDYAWEVRDALERQLPNIKWLIREHCDLGDTLAVVETRVRELFRELCREAGCPDTNPIGRKTLAFIDTLAALRRPQ
jgi:hypothetical protein